MTTPIADLRLRRATPADARIVSQFNQALAWESEGKRLSEPVLAAGVAAVLADPGKGFYTLAEQAGEVVGQCLITYEWSDWRNGWFWWIQSVYVKESARRRGVFRQLFEHIREQACQNPEVIGLRLYVEEHNQRARQTYLALGLEPEPYGLMGLYPLPGREASTLQIEATS